MEDAADARSAKKCWWLVSRGAERCKLLRRRKAQLEGVNYD